jgi:hypothetical protein
VAGAERGEAGCGAGAVGGDVDTSMRSIKITASPREPPGERQGAGL